MGTAGDVVRNDDMPALVFRPVVQVVRDVLGNIVEHRLLLLR